MNPHPRPCRTSTASRRRRAGLPHFTAAALVAASAAAALGAQTVADRNHAAAAGGATAVATASRTPGDPVATPRIAIAFPAVSLESGDIEQVAGGVRGLLHRYLTGPTLDSLELEARLESQALGEAKARGCHYVAFLSLTHKRASRGLWRQVAGTALGSAAASVPVGNNPAAAAGRAAASSAAWTAASTGWAVGARDQLRLELRLIDPSGQVVLTWADQSKARVDGDDLFTPLVSQSAERIAAFVGR